LSKLLNEAMSLSGMEAHDSIATKTATAMGSLRWMARELFASDAQTVSMESDVWAFGMTLLVCFTSHRPAIGPCSQHFVQQELFSSNLPYHSLKNDYAVIVAVYGGTLPERPPRQCGIDEELWVLCLNCWRENPALRPTAREIARQMWTIDLK
jgi:serine/threonine protein kinase